MKEFRIIKAEELFECVAKFPCHLDEDQHIDYNEFEKALMGWFRGQPYQEEHKRRTLAGEINPFQTWEAIKRDYGLKSDYDTSKVTVSDS